ncbi:SLATT domain-containing protein [Streptomyces sp. NPDC059352]|uniref:SLATT domain-containing protein n=1 Tax=Streptomyces sp. NPDC059352 TaxID=3346810 RepID=UPI0036ADB2C2
MALRRPPAPAPGSLSDDLVLDYALRELEWFTFTRNRARLGHYATEFGALATGSVTVIAAGLHAPAVITATIAGMTVFIGGLRQAFDHGGRYVLAAEAWARLSPAVERYRLLSPSERTPEARERLLERIEAVMDFEIVHWGTSLRQGHSMAGPSESPPGDGSTQPAR